MTGAKSGTRRDRNWDVTTQHTFSCSFDQNLTFKYEAPAFVGPHVDRSEEACRIQPESGLAVLEVNARRPTDPEIRDTVGGIPPEGRFSLIPPSSTDDKRFWITQGRCNQ